MTIDSDDLEFLRSGLAVCYGISTRIFFESKSFCIFWIYTSVDSSKVENRVIMTKKYVDVCNIDCIVIQEILPYIMATYEYRKIIIDCDLFFVVIQNTSDDTMKQDYTDTYSLWERCKIDQNVIFTSFEDY